MRFYSRTAYRVVQYAGLQRFGVRDLVDVGHAQIGRKLPDSKSAPHTSTRQRTVVDALAHVIARYGVLVTDYRWGGLRRH